LLQWKGPYKVEECLGMNDYKSRMGSKLKTFHVNMLCLYKKREDVVPSNVSHVAASAVIDAANNEEDEELLSLPNPKGQEIYKDVNICEDLSAPQKKELEALIEQYQHIFSELPGCTNLETHKIKLTSDTPIRSKPYPVSYAIREIMKE
jgi:hypothetical protein